MVKFMQVTLTREQWYALSLSDDMKVWRNHFVEAYDDEPVSLLTAYFNVKEDWWTLLKKLLDKQFPTSYSVYY